MSRCRGVGPGHENTMGVVFPAESFSITIADGDIVMLRICDLCGAAVVEADGT